MSPKNAEHNNILTNNCAPVSDDGHILSTSSTTVITRDHLFPPAVAKENGLDEKTFSTIEAPCSGNLYDALLLYAAQYAVDLTEDLSVLYSNSKEKSTPNDTKINNSIKTTHDDCDGKADAPLKTKDLSHAAHIAPEVRQFLEAGPHKTLITKRDGPGRLSSLWNRPEDDLESFDSSSSSDSDSDSDTETTYGLRQRRPPRVQRWQLGLGYAKLLLINDDDDVDDIPINENNHDGECNQSENNNESCEQSDSNLILLRHVALAPPLSSRDDFAIYRTLVCAAKDPKTLQRLCALVTKWKEDRADAGNRSRPGTFTLYRYKLYGSSGTWERQRRKRGRPINSVILKDRMLEAIVNDVKDFCAKDTKAWYEEHGIPHRRSLLFWGPPGTGKTSTIKMLAGMFKLNACFLSFTSPDFSNQSLHDALSCLPGRALLVLEDVDVLFNEDRKAETSSSVTFSGLLNAIDGLISVDGIITIFTTNHLERLDRALIRGGRVDRRFEFVQPNGAHIANVFRSFYPNADHRLAKEFANVILNRKEDEARTIATMQQHFIFTRRLSAKECIDKVPEFFEEYYAEGGRTRSLIYT